ncbi:MAG: hemopexin repeat-containing protein [Thermacetogeniaceae bacterium]
MKTSGFDLLLEIKDDLIDRALAIAFYTSTVPMKVEGRVAVSEKLPPEMKSLGDIDFELRLKEPPTVDVIQNGAIRLIFSIEFVVKVLIDLRYTFDVIGAVAVIPQLDTQTNKLIIDLSQGQVDEVIFQHRDRIPVKTMKALNEVIKDALKAHLLDKMEQVDLTPFMKPLELLPNPLEGIDAAVVWDNGKAYFFKGMKYFRYDIATGKIDPGFPCRIVPDWPGLWDEGVDAAMAWNGKAYFFHGSQYVRYDIATRQLDPGYPREITDGWKGVWGDGIDAAVTLDNIKAIFFKGSEHISYDLASDKVDGPPVSNIIHPWLWPSGIDAVVAWNNGKAYFFKGAEYISLNIATLLPDDQNPLKIAESWPVLWMGGLPMPVTPGGLITLDERVIAAGLNIFHNPPGNIPPVQNYTDAFDIWLGLSEHAMHQVFDDIWLNAAYHRKRLEWQKTYSPDGSTWDTIKNLINGFDDILAAAVSAALGLVVSADINIDNVTATCSATVSVAKPGFDLLPGSAFEVSNLRFDVGVYLSVDVDWEVDLSVFGFPVGTLKRGTSNVMRETLYLYPTITDVQTKLICDLNNGFYGQVTDLKVDLHFSPGTFLDMISQFFSGLLNDLIGLILQAIPPIYLFPAVISDKVEIPRERLHLQDGIITIDAWNNLFVKELTFDIEPGPVTTDDHELTAEANIRVAEMPRTAKPLPLFVANLDPKSLKVHRLNCEWVDKIDQVYRQGYYVLIDAIHDGFTGCKYCLPEYHRASPE